MSMHNWQYSEWPRFSYSLDHLEERFLSFVQKSGHLSGKLQALSPSDNLERVLQLMVDEAVTTSEIEGEVVSKLDVLSSIQRNLNIHPAVSSSGDKKAEGVGTLMALVRNQFNEPLSHEMLFEWHKVLLEGTTDLDIGMYRSDPAPMQIISGPMGRLTVHFEAPPASNLHAEMDAFISWFNTPSRKLPTLVWSPVRAAIAHLYFESIHPFDDGNGRVGRALVEKCLSMDLGFPVPISMSTVIMARRKEYYAQLERAQQSLEITDWITWFVDVLLESFDASEAWIDFTIQKRHYFEKFGAQFNERQRKAILRMFEAGPDGFTGGMNARKYGAINKTSKATATRDLQELLEIGAITRLGTAGGRSTSYTLAL